MASLATKEQAKLAIKMLNKTNHYVANEYKHRNHTNNLNNSIQEKDKRYKKPVEEKQLHKIKTCCACGSKEHLIKSCKTNTKPICHQWRMAIESRRRDEIFPRRVWKDK